MTSPIEHFVVQQVQPHLWPGETIQFLGGARYSYAKGDNALLAVTNLRLIAIKDGRRSDWNFRAFNAGVEVWELKHVAMVELGLERDYNERLTGPTFTLHTIAGAGPREAQRFFVPSEAPEFSRQADLVGLGPQLAGYVEAGYFRGVTADEDAYLRSARAAAAAAVRDRSNAADDRSDLWTGGCGAVLAVAASVALFIASYVVSWSPTRGAWGQAEDYVPLWLCSACCCMMAPALLGWSFFLVRRRRARGAGSG